MAVSNDSHSTAVAKTHKYPDLLQLCVAYPIWILAIQKMLKQPNSLMHLLDPQVLSVNAWLLSTDICQHKAFLRGLEACYQPSGQFICWCSQRQNDLYSASSAECADFLTFLFYKNSTVDTDQCFLPFYNQLRTFHWGNIPISYDY